ncbi:MAG TPA: hypothetical protein VKX28_11090 [Xanthobacteraceae bacterium]|jgi:hypothetical protein|nr:hypothetical protein [Xanthobacteraceae bacterium]
MRNMVAGGLLALLLLAGCAPTSVEPGLMQAVKRVAVFSAIGDRFAIKKLGITVFQNDLKEMPIESWGIDDFVLGKVRSVLNGRFETRPAGFTRAGFDTTGNNFTQIADAVRAQARGSDVDAYIIVTKGSSQLAGTNQGVYGLGLLERSGLGSPAVDLYALYWITVVDGRRFTVIANSPAYPLSETVLSMKVIRGPSRELDTSWMPQTLDAGQNLRLKSALMDLLDRNLPGTVAALKLTP